MLGQIGRRRGRAAPLHPLPCGVGTPLFPAPRLPSLGPSCACRLPSLPPSCSLHKRMVPIRAFRPPCSVDGQSEARVVPPRPAGWGFPSAQPSSSGLKNQTVRVCPRARVRACGAGETLSCSPSACVSHFSRLFKGLWLGVCRPSRPCSLGEAGPFPLDPGCSSLACFL